MNNIKFLNYINNLNYKIYTIPPDAKYSLEIEF